MYQDFDALSLMQQAPAGFVTEAMMPVTSFGQGLGNSDLAGAYMPFVQPSMTPRFGLGGLVAQPDNSGSLPGATTTLPASPEQPKPVTATQATDPFSVPEGVDRTTAYLIQELRKMTGESKEFSKEQADYIFEKERQRAKEANEMALRNTMYASFLKDVPKALSEPARRRNMYLDDMLRSQADAARRQAVGIGQIAMSNPGANIPARNYIRI